MLEDPNLDATNHAVFTPDGTKLIAVNRVKGISVWDLRLIRRQLKELGLDWDWPEFRAAANADVPRTPLKIQLIDADAHYQRGVALAAKGLLDESAAQFREAMRLSPDYTNARQALARVLNHQAWVLATHAEPKKRDPGRAIKLAQEAVKLAPNEGMIWNTLGVAHYRAAEWKNALAALTRSSQLQADNAYDWFFLAMTHWQLDDKGQARKWYDKAVEWMDKNAKENEELRRFRSEAEELLKKESGIRSQESEKKPN
jgi:tetratricopeptide (TPR) repeat protein